MEIDNGRNTRKPNTRSTWHALLGYSLNLLRDSVRLRTVRCLIEWTQLFLLHFNIFFLVVNFNFNRIFGACVISLSLSLSSCCHSYLYSYFILWCCPIMTCPCFARTILYFNVPYFSVMSCPVPVLSCIVLSCIVLSYPVMSNPFLNTSSNNLFFNFLFLWSPCFGSSLFNLQKNHINNIVT